ncbi:hypothetical protein LCGC14_0445320 [marine sediment metagenome]|uniref:Uncharacterized protein n=1 Tax=marine sediment metagenome TaxID=412755 RepID=A0A0F9SJC4_9ZZZZ
MPKPSDQELVTLFTKSITLGLPISVAATNARIHEVTARDWIHKGEDEYLANVENPDWVPSSHAEFALAFKEAEAAFMADKMTLAVDDIRAAPVGKRWMGAITVLERRYPEHYGKREHLDVTSTQLTISVTVPPAAVAALTRTLDNTKLLAARADGPLQDTE